MTVTELTTIILVGSAGISGVSKSRVTLAKLILCTVVPSFVD